MAKYSFEFKKKVVTEYINGQGGTYFLAEKYGIANHAQIQRWVAAYNNFGDNGLLRSRKKETYSFDFKLHVVELYLTTEVSYQELALQVGINNPPLITKWVNDFRIAGSDALKPKRKGRTPVMKIPKNTYTPDTENISVESEYLKQLEEENLKLRIENAYLKELRRLRLEEKTLLKKQRESSTASEENSN